MPDQPTTCRYCGQPASAHVVSLSEEGVARVGAYGTDGRLVWCSDRTAERRYFEGEIGQWRTLARSLTLRATRIETGTTDDPVGSLRRWAREVQWRADRFVEMVERHY